MSESTFIFFVIITLLLITFIISGLCVALWMRIKESKYHARVQSKVINLQATMKKGK